MAQRSSSLVRLFSLVLLLPVSACAASSSSGDDGTSPFDSGAKDSTAATDSNGGGDETGGSMDGGFNAETTPTDAEPSGTAVIYASTDTELWSMDPATKKVTKIGAFDFGSATPSNVTDVAVDKDGNVFVNTETTVYTAALPSGGSGKVVLTKKLDLPTSGKFYALGMTPAGVLETGESLVAGDSDGVLWWIPSGAGSATKLGTFGTWASGDPGTGGKTGYVWELSGDVVFFSAADGSPRGLATVRPCSSTGTCAATNDVVVEIDMTELAKKSSTAKLRKGFLGSATGYGKLFGIGAWDADVYAFSLGSSTNPAKLVAIDSSGSGSVLQTFPMITDGWTGAGVTTKAKVSVIK